MNDTSMNNSKFAILAFNNARSELAGSAFQLPDGTWV